MNQYVQTSAWVRDRSRPLLTYLTVAAVIFAVLVIGWLIYSRRSANAADSLARAMAVNDATVANPIPATLPPGAIAFTSEDEKHRKAYEAFTKAANEYSSYNGEIARYMAAIHQLNFEPDKAEATLKDLSQKDSQVGAQARMALANYYEKKGNNEQALAEYQKLKAKAGPIPASLVDISLARVYEALGKTAEAADLYFAVASNKDMRNTSLGNTAVTRLAVIAPDKADKLPAAEPANPLGGLGGMQIPAR